MSYRVKDQRNDDTLQFCKVMNKNKDSIYGYKLIEFQRIKIQTYEVDIVFVESTSACWLYTVIKSRKRKGKEVRNRGSASSYRERNCV